MNLEHFSADTMRITKQLLVRRWAVSTLLAILVFAVLAASDLRLEALSGFGTAELQRFSTAQQYNAAFMVWPSVYAVRAGFNWGLDYLLMPLYAASFFYSAIIAREAFAPAGSRFHRIITMLAAVPVAGAMLDMFENALQLFMMLSGATVAAERTPPPVAGGSAPLWARRRCWRSTLSSASSGWRSSRCCWAAS